MKLNSPLPQTLPKECQKAAKIREYGPCCELRLLNITVSSFVDSKNNRLDGVSSFVIRLPHIFMLVYFRSYHAVSCKMPKDLRSSLSSKLGSSSQRELGLELSLQNSRMDVSSALATRYRWTTSVIF